MLRISILAPAAGMLAVIPCIACDTRFPAPGQLMQRLPGAVLLSEVVADPPGSDGPWEFVELEGPAGNSLEGHYLLFVEGDAESNPGTVDRVVDLGRHCEGGCRLGSNGVALFTSSGGHKTLDGAATEALGFSSNALENGSLSLLLADCDASPQAGDLDPDDAGSLGLPADCTLLDAVAWTDGDVGDFTYGPRISTQDPSAACRSGELHRALDAAAWFSGQLAGEPNSLEFVDSSCLTLTPGASNAACSPESGASAATPGNAGVAGAAGAASSGEPGDDTGAGARPTVALAGGESGWEHSLVRGGASSRAGSSSAADALPVPPSPPATASCGVATLPAAAFPPARVVRTGMAWMLFGCFLRRRYPKRAPYAPIPGQHCRARSDATAPTGIRDAKRRADAGPPRPVPGKHIGIAHASSASRR